MRNRPEEDRPSPVLIAAVLLWMVALCWGMAILESKLQPLPQPIRDTAR